MEKSKVSDTSKAIDDEICISATKIRNDMKRRVHNGIEKRRKDKINYWIHKIADLLPFKDPKRESKTHLLENIYQYILSLKEKNESLMFGNINTIHAEEVRRLTKKCKELEEKNISYYRLLQTAGISPNASPEDIWDRPKKKYSNKITKEQIQSSALFKKCFNDILSDSETTLINNNNKRNSSDSEPNDQQIPSSNSNKKSKSKSKTKKRKESKKEIDGKDSPPTPLMSNSSNNTISSNTNSSTSGQTSSSGSIVLLNDQNVSTVSDETPRLIVNSGSGLNSLNTIQIRPTVGTQQLQFLSTAPTIDTTMHSNANLLSGQLLFNLNPTPPQPQATAVLLPNGQILPIITQPQPPQQPLIYAPNHGFLLTTPTAAQTQPTIITGQTASIATNITANTIHLAPALNESQSQKSVANQNLKTKVKTTTIETVPISPKPIKRKVNKKHKKILAPKAKIHKKDNHVIDMNNSNNDAKNSNSDISTEISDEISKNVEILNNNKTSSSDNSKSSNNSAESDEISKSRVTTTKTTPESDADNCDILAKATESIFSPPPNSEKCNKKEDLSVSEGIKKHSNNDNTSDKCKKRQDSQPKSSNDNQNEVISKYCANITNKAIELINDTNKNDNYVTTNENNSKIEQNIAVGNKEEIIKKSNNATNDSSGSDSAHKLSNDERTAEATFTDSSIISSCQNSSTTSTLTFGFCNAQNHNNNNESQTIVNENELPSLLLSSLTDENDVSAESVHSVSNSSLPAFLSLSPEHLTEFLPKDNITNSTQTTSTPLTREPLSGNSIQFRLNSNEQNVDQHSIRHESTRIQHQKDQTFPQYSKSNEISVASTPQTETRSYSSNFPTISSLINNEFSEFPTNKSVPNNSNSYLENLNPNINKVNHQSNNFVQFPLQNDNSLMPLYPMHPYQNHLNNNSNNNNNNNNVNANRDINSNSNQTFFNPNETQSTILSNTAAKAPQNQSQTRPQQQQQAQQPQPKPSQTHSSQVPQSQPQTQPTNNVMPIRTHRNSSSEQQLQPQHNNVRQEQRHPPQQPQHSRESVPSTTTTTNTLNKTTNSAQYSTQNSFSSYSAEALIRQNEPSLEQIQANDQNRYNNNNNNSISSRIPQQNQSQSSNMSFSDTSGIRSSSRATISYSAESLIQSNSINNSNQVTNKSSRREVENESLNNASNDNRISYYQHMNNNTNNGNSNNPTQRNDQNANTLFNFDHTLNSRITTSTSSATSHNFNNNMSVGYPQITFNSHLPDIRTSTATTSSNSSLFPIGSNSTTVVSNTSNTNRSLSSTPANSINSNNSNNNNTNSSINSNTNNSINSNNPVNNTNNNNQSANSQSVSSLGVGQHSPIIYPSHSQNSNTQQNKRTANTFNPPVNPFSHSSVESYVNTSNTSMYSSSSLVDTSNHYQRSTRNNDIRLTNCLQPTNQNVNTSVPQHNNANSGCFFSNTGPVSVHSNTTSFFPPSSATPFPPLLPSAASPFDATTFGGSHRAPMFANTFMTDFNASFVNSSGSNSLTPIASTNFNINSPIVNNNNSNTANTNNKSRDQQQSHTRSSSANMSRSPNPSKHTKISTSNANNTKSSSKKSSNANKQQNTTSDTTNNSSTNSTLRHLNDNNNYFSMSDFVSSTATTPQTNNRYSNFFSNPQTHTPSRHPVPSPVSLPSTHSSTNKNTTSSVDTSSSYPLFRPQSQNNGININFQSSPGSFSVNSLHNANRSASTTTASNFVPSSSHHSHHVTNFNLSNIFPDINSNATESLSLSPMKFGTANPILAPPPPPPPPPVAPVVPPPVASSVGQSSSMDISATTYPNHSGSHHQNLYHSHHHSSRISTPHNTMPFNSFLSSGTTSTQHTNTHNFDHHLTGNNRTSSTSQMTGIGNSSHSSPSFASSHHSHHTYANIVPSFNFSMHEH